LSGQVLVSGGYADSKMSGGAEIYDTNSLSFTSIVGVPKVARQGHISLLLQSGKVLLAGGKNRYTILKSAELYEPAANQYFFTAGSMKTGRYRFTATLLKNGKVLLAGGQSASSINKTAELYDPTSDSFSYTSGMMTIPRDAHAATLLSDGKVLITGGLDGISISSTAEIYDPATSRFTSAGRMNAARAFHTAVRLFDGKILIAGGYNGSYLDSAELYDPQTGTFSLIPSMNVERSRHTSTLLSDGTVLIAGGTNTSGSLYTAEIYDPESGIFLSTNNTMFYARSSHTATLLLNDVEGTNDKVLIAGGYGYNLDSDAVGDDGEVVIETLTSAETYEPETRLFTRSSTSMSTNRQGHTATLLSAGTQAGYIRVQSTRGLLFTEVYSNGGSSTAINGLDVDKHVGVTRIYSPQFTISSIYDTLVNVINGNKDSAAEVSLILHASNGAVLATQTRILASNAQIKGNLLEIFQGNSGLQGQTGWLEVRSSVDRIVGTMSLTNMNNTVLAVYELSGIPMQHFVYPMVSEDALYSTRISLLNSGSQTATVQLELWGESGTLDETATISLASDTHISQTLSQIFPGMDPHSSGNVRVRSNRPIYGSGTLSDSEMHFISSVPPAVFPEP
jgi:hypothetical protein